MRRHGSLSAAAMTLALLTSASAAAMATAQEERRASRLPDSVRSWAYQLQELDVDELTDSRFDLLVVDYSIHGDADSELTAEQVRRIREDGPCGERVVLAYLSIGEAEDYRYYFDPDWLGPNGQPSAEAPGWLGPTNPEWEGNYKVRYWQAGWRRILMGSRAGGERGYLDRIIDGYEYWGAESIGGNGERPTAARDMVTLVRRIARHARRARGASDFLVVPQNGSGIIDRSAHGWASKPAREARRQLRRYFRRIDAIGAEDTFFFGGRDEDNAFRPQRQTIRLLERFDRAGKPVLAIDYLTERPKIGRFWRKATARGWLPYVSGRELDELTIPAGHAPSCE